MTQTIIYILIVINIITFLAYGIDKWKAKQGSWRISEATSHQVKTDDASVVKSLFESLMRRLARPHRHSPSHHAVFLCLDGSHVADHLGRIAKLRCNKLLVKKSDGYRVHTDFFSELW